MRIFLSLLIGVIFFVVVANMPKKGITKEYGFIARFEEGSGIVESSGLLRSRQHKGVYWTINDSGNEAELFAFTLDGRLKKRYICEGGRCVDWEALAMDKQGNFYIADVGDNFHIRFEARLYRFQEPLDLSVDQKLKIDQLIKVSYVGGKRYNCEALCTTPEEELMLITRTPKPEAMYVLRESKWQPLQTIKVKGEITGADINDLGELAVLTYKGITLFRRDEFGKWKKKKYLKMKLKQCEGICWEGDGDLIVTNEEGEIYRINPRE